MTKRNIALVAHDNKKQELMTWAKDNQALFANIGIYATGTTGRLVEQTLNRPVQRLLSGPLGGDQQIGAKIAEGAIDVLIFFWDPLEPQPHDPDIKALLRIAALYNIPVACNKASADYIINSPLLHNDYKPDLPDFSAYTSRQTPIDIV
ncbi:MULTISPECIES: methylglyoxal synthase [Reinekea]|jgi:methylglyoxal synthase|uniref:Methylglyoxal synthase n=1 Tax=Reinekea forsetii TaxID=1336806 RepID=A0A2K8KQN2_9GAMM|nr:MULTISPECIES: methylglyoxal synthase [Reinekea]ATX76922.1 methylglyoxal synthase [Reinekea forsetii]MDO7644542.1 methylglyoxal synthase [Reinekea forsetii]